MILGAATVTAIATLAVGLFGKNMAGVVGTESAVGKALLGAEGKIRGMASAVSDKFTSITTPAGLPNKPPGKTPGRH